MGLKCRGSRCNSHPSVSKRAPSRYRTRLGVAIARCRHGCERHSDDRDGRHRRHGRVACDACRVDSELRCANVLYVVDHDGRHDTSQRRTDAALVYAGQRQARSSGSPSLAGLIVCARLSRRLGWAQLRCRPNTVGA